MSCGMFIANLGSTVFYSGTDWMVWQSAVGTPFMIRKRLRNPRSKEEDARVEFATGSEVASTNSPIPTAAQAWCSVSGAVWGDWGAAF